MTSKLNFLQISYLELFKVSELSENLIYVDPGSSLSKSRLFSEKVASLIWQFEKSDVFDGNQLKSINQLFYRNSIPEIIKYLPNTIHKSSSKAPPKN